MLFIFYSFSKNMSEQVRTRENYDILKARADKDDQELVIEIEKIMKEISRLQQQLVAKEFEREDLAQDWSIRLGNAPQNKTDKKVIINDEKLPDK
jgi:hypothetical protein